MSEVTFVITGKLASMKRKEAEQIIKDYGYNVGSSITKSTAYLVVGENPGEKLEKAKQQGVTILDEDDFHRIFR